MFEKTGCCVVLVSLSSTRRRVGNCLISEKMTTVIFGLHSPRLLSLLGSQEVFMIEMKFLTNLMLLMMNVTE